MHFFKFILMGSLLLSLAPKLYGQEKEEEKKETDRPSSRDRQFQNRRSGSRREGFRRRGGSRRNFIRSSKAQVKEGQMAPNLVLPLLKETTETQKLILDSKKRVKLSDFKNKKPIVLIFGSYT